MKGVRAAIAGLQKAREKELTLKKKFEDVGQAPDLVKDLAHLDVGIVLATHLAAEGLISRDSLVSLIGKLTVEKFGLIGRNFSATLFGVPAADAIAGFTEVDTRLTGAIDSLDSFGDTEAVVVYLEHAKKAKHELEDEFAAAASCSQPKVRGLAVSAAACPSPSLTLNCPPTATLGGELAVSGSVTPAAAGESVGSLRHHPAGAYSPSPR